jgi:hypothetical protein
MDFSEFVAVAAAPKAPELQDFERMTVFAHGAAKEDLWMAMGTAGIHPIYRNLIAHALQRQMIEELEREQTRKRKLEEEARLVASKDDPTKDGLGIEGVAPRRRMR